ncbi:transposase [Streptantibioticus ferralitis]|uniref:transposase n=1 Tax=Streptantibioticus ferralitis TaxID=236510 RepID=UPI0035573EB8
MGRCRRPEELTHPHPPPQARSLGCLGRCPDRRRRRGAPRPQRAPGPRPVAARHCLQGILYVLYNDIAWQLLPLKTGFGSGQTCWRHLRNHQP